MTGVLPRLPLEARAIAGRLFVMQILNATPDSFYDGGRWTPEEAARAAGAATGAGVAILDIGGESTRPGADPVPADLERERILPIFEAVRFVRAQGVLLSVDTRKAEVARAALAAGAEVVNDVAAGRDPEMFPVVRDAGATIVLMHMKGEPKTMQERPYYDDPVAEVRAFLAARAAAARAAGIPPERIWLDPGIGFGKRLEDNLAILRAPEAFFDLGHTVVLGVSRKSFLGGIGAGDRPAERLAGSLAVASLWARAAIACGGRLVVRTHDGAETAKALRAAAAVAA